jgi:hypothetical protein
MLRASHPQLRFHGVTPHARTSHRMTHSPFPDWPRFSIDPQGRAFVPPRIEPPVPGEPFDPRFIPRPQALSRGPSHMGSPAVNGLSSLPSQPHAG